MERRPARFLIRAGFWRVPLHSAGASRYSRAAFAATGDEVQLVEQGGNTWLLPPKSFVRKGQFCSWEAFAERYGEKRSGEMFVYQMKKI